MEYLKYILPVFIVVLAMVLRLYVDRSPEGADFTEAFCEVPTDFAFLSLSFITAFIISTPELSSEKISLGMAVFFVNVFVAIATVILRSYSVKAIDSDNKRKWLRWHLPNIGIAAMCIFVTISSINSPFLKDEMDIGNSTGIQNERHDHE